MLSRIHYVLVKKYYLLLFLGMNENQNKQTNKKNLLMHHDKHLRLVQICTFGFLQFCSNLLGLIKKIKTSVTCTIAATNRKGS